MLFALTIVEVVEVLFALVDVEFCDVVEVLFAVVIVGTVEVLLALVDVEFDELTVEDMLAWLGPCWTSKTAGKSEPEIDGTG